MKANSTFTLEQLWDEAGFKPDDEQKEAILYTGGPLYPTLVKGSGRQIKGFGREAQLVFDVWKEQFANKKSRRTASLL